MVPSWVGGTNWNGAGADPETGILYVPTIRHGSILGLVPTRHPESDIAWGLQQPVDVPGPRGLPLFKPTYGSLVAIDLNEGEIGQRRRPSRPRSAATSELPPNSVRGDEPLRW